MSFEMLKILKSSLKRQKEAEKFLYKISDDLISQLPEDKRKQGSILMSEARKGNVDLASMNNFASGVRGLNKEEFEKNVSEAIEKINAKKK